MESHASVERDADIPDESKKAKGIRSASDLDSTHKRVKVDEIEQTGTSEKSDNGTVLKSGGVQYCCTVHHNSYHFFTAQMFDIVVPRTGKPLRYYYLKYVKDESKFSRRKYEEITEYAHSVQHAVNIIFDEIGDDYDFYREKGKDWKSHVMLTHDFGTKHQWNKFMGTLDATKAIHILTCDEDVCKCRSDVDWQKCERGEEAVEIMRDKFLDFMGSVIDCYCDNVQLPIKLEHMFVDPREWLQQHLNHIMDELGVGSEIDSDSDDGGENEIGSLEELLACRRGRKADEKL